MDNTASPREVARASPEHPKTLPAKWSRIAIFLVIGYLSMSRSFAYLGLPWINLYIGEIFLAAFLLFSPRTNKGRWVSVALRLQRLKRLKWLLLLFLCYGGFEALRGMLKGYPAFTAARDTAFNYYPFFLFLGIWAGVRDRDLLRRVVRMLAWWNGVYGLAYVVILSRLPLTMPGTANAASPVPLFSEPYGSAIALLGLLAFEPELRRVWHLLALNALVMLWVQVRAEWVGFVAGLIVFAWCTKRLKRLAVACAAVMMLLGAMYLTNISLLSPTGRGGQISANYLIARAVAPINREFANNLAPSEDVSGFAATADWRLVWWAGIWSRVRANTSSAMLGLSYGYPIGDLNPLLEGGEFIQTPHSDFFYALGYSGWIGVAFFALVQLELLRLNARTYLTIGQPFGLMCWTALLATSLFEDFFEAPFGAIPFFLLMGMAIVPALLDRRPFREAEVPAPFPHLPQTTGV